MVRLSLARRLTGGIGALVIAAGCTGKTLAVGSGSAEETGGGDAGGGRGGSPVAWTGYVENYAFPSGSDVVTLALATAADGTVTGTARFGTLPLYAPPTDPSSGYPPTESFLQSELPTSDPESYLFTIQGGTLDGTRLRFSVDQYEIWTQWCALQTTTYLWPDQTGPDGGALYACVPNGPLMGNGTQCSMELDGGDSSISCDKWVLCNGPGSVATCTCNASTCWWQAGAGGPIYSFDMQVTPTTMDGTVGGLAGGPITVHFDRSP